MIVVDANLLLYAYNPSAGQHEKARAWLEAVISGTEPVGLAWAVILAFVRISTNPRAFPKPLTVVEAVVIVSEWMAQPVVRVVEPTDRHWALLAQVLEGAQAKGPLVTDAHLAALAIEHGATLYSTDSDFARFSRLRWRNPMVTPADSAGEMPGRYEAGSREVSKRRRPDQRGPTGVKGARGTASKARPARPPTG
jgi:toxin-antitoxin system PIN domain toxin